MSGHPFLLDVCWVLLTKLLRELELQALVAAQGKASSRAAGCPQSWHREGAPGGKVKECKLDGDWVKSVTFETVLDGIVGKESSNQCLGA